MARSHTLVVAGIPRVNLMPRAELERRDRLRLTRRWSIAAVAALAVAMLIVGGAAGLSVAANSRLASEEARGIELAAAAAEYSDVNAAITRRTQLREFRSQAMSNDLAWAPLVTEVLRALPEGVSIVEFGVTPGAAPTQAAPEDQVGAEASFTFTGLTAADQATTVDALSQLRSVAAADATTLLTAGEAGYRFNIDVLFNQTIYTGDFTREED